MSHRRHAGKRSRQALRRVLKRIALLLLVLGLLLLIFAGTWAIIGLFKSGETQQKFFKFSLIYLASGGALLIIRGIVEGARLYLKKQMRRAQHGEIDNEPEEVQTHNLYETVEKPKEKPQSKPKRERIRRSSSRRSSSSSDRRSASSEGAVLPLVLILLALLSTLLIRAQIQAQQELRLKKNLVHQSQIHHALVDTLLSTLQQIADDPNLQVDHLNETWLDAVETNRPDQVNTILLIQDLNSRFDWNNLVLTDQPHQEHRGEQILLDIMTLCGDFGPVPKIDALQDWIDADNDGYRETKHYEDSEKGYPVADGPLQTWGELLHVQEFDFDYFTPHERHTSRESFRGNLLNSLTVIPGPRRHPIPVNLNTASREVLLAIFGLSEENMVNFLISQRKEKPITSLSALAAAVDPTLAERSKGYVDVKSTFFMLTIRGYLEGAALELSALVQRDTDGDIQILQTVL